MIEIVSHKKQRSNALRKGVGFSGTEKNHTDIETAAQNNIAATLIETHSDAQNVSPRESFTTLSTQEEITTLKKWSIPAEVIYVWKAGKQLLDIDDNRLHPYSLVVNNGISAMFINQWSDLAYHAPHLQECLWKTKTRLDIGTGNGIISNIVALSIATKIGSARAQHSMKLFQQGDLAALLSLSDDTKPNFVSCDLSSESLGFAEELANNHFHDLGEFFTLQYYPDTFQKFLKSKTEEKTPRLITMFNVLANYKTESLRAMLQDIYDAMQEWDVFIPTFFQKEDRYDTSFHNKYTDFLGWWFRGLTKALYNNQETRDRCVGAFCARYRIPEEKVFFNVQRDTDGGDFIDVSIYIPSETILHIPQDDGTERQVKASDCDGWGENVSGLIKFDVFKSYRMSKQAIETACTSVGFNREYRIDSGDGMQIAPILYK